MSEFPASAEDLRIAALTVYGEARGEIFEGKFAVAWTFRNRAERHPRGRPEHPMYWGGPDLKSVCQHREAYSCWNGAAGVTQDGGRDGRGDPNLSQMNRVKPGDPLLIECEAAVRHVLAGIEDPTKGATHYHTLDCAPAWAAGHMPCYAVGHHVFFNDIA